jgi:N-acetylglutamate synthase-like GNAT family acetyltransferase
MPLDAANLLARVVALLFCRIGVLHALCVNNDEAGRGVATQFLAGLAN